MQEPEYLYEDDDLIVCHKPAGVATQTKRIGQKDMESLLRNHVALAMRKAGRSGVPYIGVVHRLDQPVEGVMVFAKTSQAAAKLSAQVRERSIGKHYYALVQLPEGAGTFSEATGLQEKGTLSDEILFEPKQNLSRIVPKGTKNAKTAKLDYKLVAQKEEKALLQIALHTGRHHQIRVQLANLGTPICGDTKYGKDQPGELALCSYRISFFHPEDGRRMEFEIRPENRKIRELYEDSHNVQS